MRSRTLGFLAYSAHTVGSLQTKWRTSLEQALVPVANYDFHSCDLPFSSSLWVEIVICVLQFAIMLAKCLYSKSKSNDFRKPRFSLLMVLAVGELARNDHDRLVLELGNAIICEMFFNDRY